MPHASWSQAWEAHSRMLQSMVTDALGTKALDGHSLKLHLLREVDRQDEELQGGNTKTPGQRVFCWSKSSHGWSFENEVSLERWAGDTTFLFLSLKKDTRRHGLLFCECLKRQTGTLFNKKGGKSTLLDIVVQEGCQVTSTLQLLYQCGIVSTISTQQEA